eukprot:1724395-Rhodomonas_salina.1
MSGRDPCALCGTAIGCGTAIECAAKVLCAVCGSEIGYGAMRFAVLRSAILLPGVIEDDVLHDKVSLTCFLRVSISSTVRVSAYGDA